MPKDLLLSNKSAICILVRLYFGTRLPCCKRSYESRESRDEWVAALRDAKDGRQQLVHGGNHSDLGLLAIGRNSASAHKRYQGCRLHRCLEGKENGSQQCTGCSSEHSCHAYEPGQAR